jgi:hypothetical protein
LLKAKGVKRSKTYRQHKERFVISKIKEKAQGKVRYGKRNLLKVKIFRKGMSHE